MAQVCPSCGVSVDIDDTRCPACNEVLDPNATILPPRLRAEVPPRRVQADPIDRPGPNPLERGPDPAPRAERAEHSPSSVAKRKPRPMPPQPARQAPPPPPPRHEAPPPPPPAPTPYIPPYAPPAPPPLLGAPPSPAGFRGKLIKWLGGQPEANAPAGPAPAYPQPGQPWPQYPQPTAQPQYPNAYPGSPAPPGPAYTPPSPSGEFQAHPLTPPRALPIQELRSAEDEADDDGRTRVMSGADVARLKVPQKIFVLQILDQSGQWVPWSTIGGAGLKVGRSDKGAQFPDLITMAARHMRIAINGRKVVVEDLGALNGIYLKVAEPIELDEGRRFRIGAQVFEFHLAEPIPPVEPVHGDDGEEFWSRDQNASAYLDFIRPDGSAGVRYPITKAEPTILGREARPGRPVDLALPGAEWVSGQHAQVRPHEGVFLLEDLGSRNGTFVQIRGTAEVDPGDVLLLGKILLRVVEHSGH